MTAKEKLLKIVDDAHGDDLERAELAFRGLTEEQLKEQYGNSGRSMGEILDGYLFLGEVAPGVGKLIALVVGFLFSSGR
jgi:hypothetical protein